MLMLERVLAVVGAIASIAGLALTAAYYWRWLIWKRQLTWDDALRTAEEVLRQIEEGQWRPDLVIGLGRSGGIWGGWLAGNLGSVPFAVADIAYTEDVRGRRVAFPGASEVLASVHKTFADRVKNVLVVEGASSNGQTPREFLAQHGAELQPWEVKLAVLYKNPAVAVRIDFVGKADLEPWPERFPWHQRAVYRPHLRDILSLGRKDSHPAQAA